MGAMSVERPRIPVARYESYVRRLEVSGCQTVAYPCPEASCKAKLVFAPTAQEPRQVDGVHESVTTCPYCNCLYHFIARADGTFRVTLVST